MQCTAKAKSTGKQCRRRAVTGYTVCQVHGAGSPKQGRPGGVPKKYKAGGKYSKFLPQRLVGRFEEMQDDPELRTFDSELALIATRIMDLLSRVDTKEAGKHWFKARELHAKATASMRAGDMEEFAKFFHELGQEIGEGVSDYAAWAEVFELIDHRRKIVESENRILTRNQFLVTVDEAMQYIQAILVMVERQTDHVTYQKISADVLRLLERTGDTVIEAEIRDK